MLYKLVNPSDPYIFEAESLEVATLAAWLLSSLFAAQPQDESEDFGIPAFLDDPEAEYQTQFGRSAQDGLYALREEVGKALGSFMLGDFGDYALYCSACAAIDNPAKLEKFQAEWLDARRTSLNNIGEAAQKLSARLLRK